MKAYVLHGIGDLRYEDVPIPEIRPGWALVKVLAVGICSSDIPRIFEKGTYHFPTIPGHEFCGIVEDTASLEDRQWIGKRAGVFPLIPCRQCLSCQKGEYETCSNYDYIGSRRDGAFAEYVAVPMGNLIELPDAVSDVQGALLEPAAVALHAVKRAHIQLGDSICIVGSGAIGLLAGQWANLHGAGEIVIKGRGPEKRHLAQRCGLSYADTIPEKQFDCVIEAVGSEQALTEALSLTAPGGRLVLMGNPDGPRTLSQDAYWSILRKQLTLIGTWNSSYGGAGFDWAESVQAIARGKLQVNMLVSHQIDWLALPQMLEMIRRKAQPYIKIIVQKT